ncbi:MAG: DNA repair protein rad52 [Icmadophila ericetorum]|nr:DNA repair protein rad52 [Icmadophila ericetorum]
MPAPGEQHRESTAVTNPFEEIKPRISEYTAEQIAILQGRLSKQLGPEYISTRPGPGGSRVHYIEAHNCINLANEIFGFNGWSSEVRNVVIDYVEENEQTGKIDIGIAVIDMGYGKVENCKSKATAFEKARKEGTTDGLKRALRNFGNVLGNCIYDKEYISKVTRVKGASSRWDPDNLHRHSKSAPRPTAAKVNNSRMEGVELSSRVTEPMEIKKEPLINNGNSKVFLEDSDSTTKSGDDEFGGDDFDEIDFSVDNGDHPDEVVLEASSILKETAQAETTVKSNGGPAVRRSGDQTASLARPPASRMQSMPPLPVNGPQTPVGKAPPMIQPNKNFAPGQNSIDNHQKPNFPPPQGRSHTPQQGQQPPNQAQGHSLQIRPNAPGVPRFNAQSHQFQHQPQPNEGNNYGKSPIRDPENPGSHMNIPPVGFYAAKAAEMFNQDPNAAPPTNLPPFNPHVESPSIRKTAGVDHTKTKAIPREIVGAPAKPTFNGRPAQNSANFVNPQIDQARKIGMPGGGRGASPMQNRTSYKPPTNVNVQKRPAEGNGNGNSATMQGRPALGDVTNVASASGNTSFGGDNNNGGGNDFKRQRVGTGPQGGFGNAQNVNPAPG